MLIWVIYARFMSLTSNPALAECEAILIHYQSTSRIPIPRGILQKPVFVFDYNFFAW